MNTEQCTTDFIRQVILSHERQFYKLMTEHFDTDTRDTVLGFTRNKIMDMIATATVDYYNKLATEIHTKVATDRASIVIELANAIKVNWQSLVKMLFQATVSLHFDVNREALELDDFKEYLESVSRDIESNINVNFTIHAEEETDCIQFSIESINCTVLSPER